MEITVKLPETIDAKSMSELSKQMVALELFKTGKFSIGYCADVSGMAYDDFLLLLGQNKIPMFTRTKEDLSDELNNA
ncbi:MAG: UPF0175 family protein [Erysipelotrichaceae bacterium]|nr:UPF0175 family protein [Erysipelotrichaceae bacterium]